MSPDTSTQFGGRICSGILTEKFIKEVLSETWRKAVLLFISCYYGVSDDTKFIQIFIKDWSGETSRGLRGVVIHIPKILDEYRIPSASFANGGFH